LAFKRAVELQRAYWLHNAEEQLQLASRGIDQLDWREKLRLHHLLCLQLLQKNPQSVAVAEKCRELTQHFLALDSPYRPARQWFGKGN
jgi:hypothetical protein